MTITLQMAITNWLSSVATSQFDNNTRSYYLFSFVYFNLFWLWRKKGCHTGQTRIFDLDIGFYIVICVWTNTILYLFIRVTPIWSLWYQKPITHPYVSLFLISIFSFSLFSFAFHLLLVPLLPLPSPSSPYPYCKSQMSWYYMYYCHPKSICLYIRFREVFHILKE